MYLRITTHIYVNIIVRNSGAIVTIIAPCRRHNVNSMLDHVADSTARRNPRHRLVVALVVAHTVDSSSCGGPRCRPTPSTRRGSMRRHAPAKSCFN